MDEKISALVEAINSYGNPAIETKASCQGHLDGVRHPHPWVHIWPHYHPEENYAEKLAKLKSIDSRSIKSFAEAEYIEYEIKVAKKIMGLVKIIGEFNEVNPIKWKLDDQWLASEKRAENPDELETLQKSASDLAEYIKISALSNQ